MCVTPSSFYVFNDVVRNIKHIRDCFKGVLLRSNAGLYLFGRFIVGQSICGLVALFKKLRETAFFMASYVLSLLVPKNKCAGFTQLG